MLMGEAASAEVLDDVTAMITAQENVDSVKPLQSIFLSPDETTLVVLVCFKQTLSLNDGCLIIQDIKKSIQDKYPYFTRIAIEPDNT